MMKLTLEDDHTIVEIELKNPTGHISELVDMTRGAAASLGFHPESIKHNIPNDDDIDEMLQEVVKELGG